MVLLEPNSRLSQAAGTSREFSLAGAATFTVQHAAGATFRVRRDVAVVTVTGTVFRVDASTAGVTAVTVSEGRVLPAGTDAGAPALALTAGERGRIREGEGPVRVPR
ncbi:MAG: FecR domain-containing protein [Gemmatimonadetes bacterium]|nr:FecR domain-containing protein [Gemmatimonadota bacterium]